MPRSRLLPSVLRSRLTTAIAAMILATVPFSSFRDDAEHRQSGGDGGGFSGGFCPC